MIQIFHNPHCSHSRQVLDLLIQKGLKPEIFTHQNPPKKALLKEWIKQANLISLRQWIRQKDDLYGDLNLNEASEEALFEAILNYPKLLNRPIVITNKGAKLCRPPEALFELLEGN